MLPFGHLMRHVLQCRQFEKSICRWSPSRRYTSAGQNRVQGEPNSFSHAAHAAGSLIFRWHGWSSSRQPVRLHRRGLHVVRRLAREALAHERLQRSGVALVAARHAEPRDLPERHPREPGRHHAPRHAERERRAHVPHALHLLPAVRRLQPLEVILPQRIPTGTTGILPGEIREDRLGRCAAALHRDVHALDAQGVEEARPVADDQHARRVGLRHGVEAALRDHLRAVGHGLAALDMAVDVRG